MGLTINASTCVPLRRPAAADDYSVRRRVTPTHFNGNAHILDIDRPNIGVPRTYVVDCH